MFVEGLWWRNCGKEIARCGGGGIVGGSVDGGIVIEVVVKEAVGGMVFFSIMGMGSECVLGRVGFGGCFGRGLGLEGLC